MARVRNIRLRRRAVFAGVALAAFLVAAELLLRAFNLTTQSGEQVYADRWLYFPLRTGSHDWDENLTLGVRVYPPDPFHYNIRAALTPKLPGFKRIICLGDSSTFGVGLSRLSLPYPQTLDRLLGRCYPQERVEVWNFGRPGASSYQGRLLAETIWAEAQPDALVFFFGANDSVFAPIRADKDWATTPGWSLRLHRALMNRSLFYRLVRSINVSYLERQATQWLTGPRPAPATRRPRVTKADFLANREALRQRVEAGGGFLLTVVCGSRVDDRAVPCAYFDDWTPGPDDIDLPALFTRELAAGRNPFADRIHPNQHGHQVLARELFAKIAERWHEPVCDVEPILAAETRAEAQRETKAAEAGTPAS